MMSSPREVVGAVERWLPRACVDAAGVAGIRELAADLPEQSESYYVECRLGPDAGPVDLLACLTAPARRPRVPHPAPSWPPEGAPRAPAWAFAGATLQRWTDASAGWSAALPFLWLEFDDVGARERARQQPSLCVCIDRSYPFVQRTRPTDARDGLALALDLILPALPPGREMDLSADRIALLSALVGALPLTGRMIHLSCMLARDLSPLKLFGALPKDALLEYLAAVAWPGPREALRQALHSFCAPDTADDTVYFDLALDRSLSGYIGLASSQLQLRRASCADPTRRALLGRFVEHGLCTVDERDALVSWVGHAVETAPARSLRVVRWLDTKLCIYPDRRAAAKAYLGFAPVTSVF